MFLFLLAGICANIFVLVCCFLFGIHTWRHIGPTLWATSCFVRVPIKRTAYFRWFIFLLLGIRAKSLFLLFFVWATHLAGFGRVSIKLPPTEPGFARVSIKLPPTEPGFGRVSIKLPRTEPLPAPPIRRASNCADIHRCLLRSVFFLPIYSVAPHATIKTKVSWNTPWIHTENSRWSIRPWIQKESPCCSLML